MKVKYFIDSIKVSQSKDRNHIVVNGWCIALDGSMPNYKIFINDEKKACDIVVIPRQDVCNKYKLSPNCKLCGFRIVIDCKREEPLKQIKVKAVFDNFSEDILDLDENYIVRNMSEDSVEYAIDGYHISQENKLATVHGWAFSYYNEPVEYSILDNDKCVIEHMARIINREDLYRLKFVDKEHKYCGFMISFKVEKNKKYFLQLKTNTYRKEIRISNMNGFKSRVRAYLGVINKENIEKGYRYLKKNGVKSFVKRIKAGPGAHQMPYHEWFENHKASIMQLEMQKKQKLDYTPKISIIVPTYNTPINFLNAMIDSVVNQSYQNWQLCIADGSDEDHEARAEIIKRKENDDRIMVTFLNQNYGISGNTNKALEIATGDYVGLFDHDDLLTPDALYEIVKALQVKKHDIIYTDEDKLDNKTQKLMDPNFKPDFSIDLFRSHNYITHFFVVKSSIIKNIGGFRSEFDGSQDYDLMFRCIEKANSIYHIPKILYHWRMHAGSTAENPESKMYCYEAGKKAIESHYHRMKISAKVEMMELWGMYHTIYDTLDNPLVSIIIPNMEHKETLQTCVESLFKVNTYNNIEIIIVENNSNSSEIFDYYKYLEDKYQNIKVVKWEREFNYSALNNFGVKHASGKYLLFLNNDTEVITPTAVSEMLGCCIREEVGIVGAKLLYEDDTVQHAGVVIGFGGFAGHVFTGINRDDYGYMVRARINCNYSAVTAACMMVDRKCFDVVGGFDERFKVSCNDIDFCLKVRELDKLIVYNAHSLWHHYESKSRGYEDNIEKIKRFESEVSLFQEKWKNILTQGDPYYNSNFKIEYGPFNLG